MHCNVRHHNRGSLYPVCSHSSCSEKTWNSSGQKKGRSREEHGIIWVNITKPRILIFIFFWQRSNMKPYKCNYLLRPERLCVHLSQFFAAHISNQNIYVYILHGKGHSLPNIIITINLGRLTGTGLISNGSDQYQEHSPITSSKKPQHPYVKWKIYSKGSKQG